MNAFDTPRTKTLRDLIEREGPNGTGRIVGLSIEGDGVFIYTNSAQWCDDSGSGTFRGDSETAAVRRFRSEVRRADASDADPASAEPASAEPASAEPASAEPASAEPASAEPASAEPASAEPAAARPCGRDREPAAAVFVRASVHVPAWAVSSWRELAQNSAWRGAETQPGGPVRFPDGSMVTFTGDGLPVE